MRSLATTVALFSVLLVSGGDAAAAGEFTVYNRTDHTLKVTVTPNASKKLEVTMVPPQSEPKIKVKALAVKLVEVDLGGYSYNPQKFRASIALHAGKLPAIHVFSTYSCAKINDSSPPICTGKFQYVLGPWLTEEKTNKPDKFVKSPPP